MQQPNFPQEMIGNPGQRTPLVPEKQYSVEDFKDMQELGKSIINTYHDFCTKKNKEVEWDIFLGAIDYIIKSHRARIEKLMGSFLTVEGVKGIEIEEPYSNEINQAS